MFRLSIHDLKNNAHIHTAFLAEMIHLANITRVGAVKTGSIEHKTQAISIKKSLKRVKASPIVQKRSAGSL